MAANLRGPFLCTREAFRIMKPAGGGRIINIASIAARRVRPHTAPCSTSKHGLWGLTQVTALEGRPFGISCGCLYPGNTLVEKLRNRKEPMMTVQDLVQAVVAMATPCEHARGGRLARGPDVSGSRLTSDPGSHFNFDLHAWI